MLLFHSESAQAMGHGCSLAGCNMLHKPCLTLLMQHLPMRCAYSIIGHPYLVIKVAFLEANNLAALEARNLKLLLLSAAITPSLPPLTTPWCCLQLVFGVLSLGAVVLTVNVVLLGGNIGFFQSLCLLGYCIFPLDIAATVTIWVTNVIARWVVVGIALLWSSWASVPFIGGSVPPARQALAVYPLLLLYTCMAWLALIR